MPPNQLLEVGLVRDGIGFGSTTGDISELITWR